MKRGRIPHTDSVQKLADFWDSHDVTEFSDELCEVREPVFEKKTVLKISLAPREAGKLHSIAHQKGMTENKLVEEWIREHTRAA